MVKSSLEATATLLMGCCRRLDQSSVRRPSLPFATTTQPAPGGPAVSIGVARVLVRRGWLAMLACRRRHAVAVTSVIAAEHAGLRWRT